MKSSEIEKDHNLQQMGRTGNANRKDDPALKAGLTNSDYFKLDTWLVGDTKYQSQRYTVPQELEGLFQPSALPRKTDADFQKANTFDKQKFKVETLWTSEEPRTTVTIFGRENQTAHASLNLDIEHGFTIYFGPPENGLFPFTVNEFCDALAVARWDLDLDVMADQKGQETLRKTNKADSSSETK